MYVNYICIFEATITYPRISPSLEYVSNTVLKLFPLLSCLNQDNSAIQMHCIIYWEYAAVQKYCPSDNLIPE